MATVELSMIVKDGAAGLTRCLRSVAGVVDRIVIGDTGSTDATCAIARAHGAEVFSVPWTEDFAAARNALLSRARCDWILVLDADEMLDPLAAETLPVLIGDLTTAAWNMRRLNYLNDLDVRCQGQQAVRNTVLVPEAQNYPAFFQSVHTRLFRREPRIMFERCVHESVAYSIDRAGLPRRDCDILIHHFGYVEDASVVRGGKEAYYHALGLQALAQGGDARAYLDTGISFLDYAGDPAAALQFLEKAAALNPNNAVTWLYLGLCSTRLGRLDEAGVHLSRSERLAPHNGLTCSAMGDVAFQQQRYAAAADAYRRAASLGTDSRLMQAKLGAALVQIGHKVEGIEKIKVAIAAGPGEIELERILATSAVHAGEWKLASGAAQRCLASTAPDAFDFVVAASVLLQASEARQALSAASIGLKRYPGSSELKELLATAEAVLQLPAERLQLPAEQPSG